MRLAPVSGQRIEPWQSQSAIGNLVLAGLAVLRRRLERFERLLNFVLMTHWSPLT